MPISICVTFVLSLWSFIGIGYVCQNNSAMVFSNGMFNDLNEAESSLNDLRKYVQLGSICVEC